jgi:hypothetical protein
LSKPNFGLALDGNLVANERHTEVNEHFFVQFLQHILAYSARPESEHPENHMPTKTTIERTVVSYTKKKTPEAQGKRKIMYKNGPVVLENDGVAVGMRWRDASVQEEGFPGKRHVLLKTNSIEARK